MTNIFPLSAHLTTVTCEIINWPVHKMLGAYKAQSYIAANAVVVVVELPQTPEDDIRNARAARGRRIS